ncbi:uncharacterized protein LOC143304175 [Bombus vancouverensis nearcticus]|uniref:uncharacterized protein LOC143304175 n=1 Tax=Bombus vancouverensis nearcticus TaxID=2705178 RepID=UPI00402B2D8B
MNSAMLPHWLLYMVFRKQRSITYFARKPSRMMITCSQVNVGCMLQSPMEFREIVVTLRWLPLQSYPTKPCVILMRVDSKSIWFREWRTGALQFYGTDCYSLD